MRVVLIGPPLSGKSTLFAAVAAAGGSSVNLSRPDQPHLAVVKVPDARLDWQAELYKPKKVTHAELEFYDLPGLNLSDEAGRNRAKTHWSAMREADMLVFVVRLFDDPATPAYRNRLDPAGDVEELLAEMIFADLDQVTARCQKLAQAVRKPGTRRKEQLQELELMRRLRETLEADRPIASAVWSETEAKLIRSFAFLSQKAALVVLNCSEQALAEPASEQLALLPSLKLSAKIEQEIARLPAEDRPEFLADLGLAAAARQRLIQACYQRMNLISFLTVDQKECRVWSVPAGTDAVSAAGCVHSDLARGFIRAETVAFDDLHAAGDMKAAKAAGKVRLEGKNYVVRDGDVIYFRFNV